MLRIFALVTLVAVLSDLTAAAAPTLDGCTFAVELVAEDGGKAEGAGKDTVSFMGGFADCVNVSTKYG